MIPNFIYIVTSHVLISTSVLTTERWFLLLIDKTCVDLNELTEKSHFDLNILTDKSCANLNIHIDNWQMAPNLCWQIMLWSWHPYSQLTDDSKFYQTSHVLISTSILTTERWFLLLIDKTCWSQHPYWEIMFWSQHPYWQILRKSQHLYWQLTDGSKFVLTNHTLILTSLFTTYRWIQILSDKSCFDLDIRTDNWQMIPMFNWQNMIWSQHPYWQLTDDSKFYTCM